MSPSVEVIVKAAALDWLVRRLNAREARRQIRIVLSILRRYTLHDYERSDEADNLVSSLDGLVEAAGRERERRNRSLSDHAVARRRCAMAQSYRCMISGEYLSIRGQVHHVMPLEYGGGWEPANLHYIDPRFHPFIHNSNKAREVWMTDEGWEKIEEYRKIIRLARLDWKGKKAKRRKPKLVLRAA